MRGISIVMPVKDEAGLLPYSLPAAAALKPDELLLMMERDTRTIRRIHRIFDLLGFDAYEIRVMDEGSPHWRLRQAYCRREGYLAARNDTILALDVDIVANPEIPGFLSQIGEYGAVSFAKSSYPVLSRYLVANIVQRIYRHGGFTGLFGFSRAAWLETEDLEAAKKVRRGYDGFVHQAIDDKYPTKFVHQCKSVCLRPQETSEYQFLQGEIRWKIRRMSLSKAVGVSLLYFRPHLLSGYLKARYS